MEETKPYHTLILDAGPIITNQPPISTLLAKSHALLTVPAIVAEIRDPAARSRFEITMKPFLTIREPKEESVKVIREFARKSGDGGVLSGTDVKVLALAYEVECERNGGDWRLRRVPGQRGLNGSPPKRDEEGNIVEEVKGKDGGEKEGEEAVSEVQEGEMAVGADNNAAEAPEQGAVEESSAPQETGSNEEPAGQEHEAAHDDRQHSLEHQLSQTHITEISDSSTNPTTTLQPPLFTTSDTPNSELPTSNVANDDNDHDNDNINDNDNNDDENDDVDDDSDGWITPSNLHKHQAEDASSTSATKTSQKQSPPKTLQVATLTTDFAMQNVLLLSNLNLLSPSLTRISRLKTHILRCHACFLQIKDLTKQFCPRCGGATLTRVSCSTDAVTGVFTLHLKKNMQWNTRGDRYSIPKPMHGSASGKVHGGKGLGGGKGGWGRELVLVEDQKEYVRGVEEGRRRERGVRDLMDEDYLPRLVSGERRGGNGGSGGKMKVGAGRTVNSRRR